MWGWWDPGGQAYDLNLDLKVNWGVKIDIWREGVERKVKVWMGNNIGAPLESKGWINPRTKVTMVKWGVKIEVPIEGIGKKKSGMR